MTEKQIVAKVHARLWRDAERKVNRRIRRDKKRVLSFVKDTICAVYYTTAYR